MSKSIPLLVLGLGNVLCGDDGLGAVAVHLLERRYVPPPGVCILDGGTLGLSLLPYVEDAEQALLIDAIRGDAPPGTLVRLEGEEVAPAVRNRLSPHQVGVADLLDGARWRDRYPRRVILVGLVPETLELGLHRSPAVEAHIPILIDSVVREAHQLGYEFIPRAGNEGATAWSASGAARVLGL